MTESIQYNISIQIRRKRKRNEYKRLWKDGDRRYIVEVKWKELNIRKIIKVATKEIEKKIKRKAERNKLREDIAV